jgi:hypothetical protein
MCLCMQAIQAGKLTNDLPNLATPSTAFAPINSAFYRILTGQGAARSTHATSSCHLNSRRCPSHLQTKLTFDPAPYPPWVMKTPRVPAIAAIHSW